MTTTREAIDPTTRPASAKEALDPRAIFTELRRGVLGQDRALRFVAVAIFKHTLGRISGNILLLGNSGTGKTTIMNNVQRLYDTVRALESFRAMTILNANLLVDSERTEFRPDRMLSAVEQRARTLLGEQPSAQALREALGVDQLPPLNEEETTTENAAA